MQKLLSKYRGVILVLLVLFIGCEMMSINVRMLENTNNQEQVIVYEK